MGRRNRTWKGLLVVLVGVCLLANQALRTMGVIIPSWVFTWPVLLMVIGFFVGMASGFRNLSWAVLILIGGMFLLDSFVPELHLKEFIWPVCLIGVGLIMVLGASFRKPRNWGQHLGMKQDWRTWKQEIKQKYDAPQSGQYKEGEEFLDSTSIFGGVLKKVYSKKFQGGQITNFMGGTEIDLSQADIEGQVIIEVTQIFGGTKIILPPHWSVKSEIIVLFGGIEDKQVHQGSIPEPGKLLVLQGTTVFGGIELRSF